MSSDRVSIVASRRRFSAGYKLQVLREADRCRKPGEIGALLQRHGLYSSHLSAWRRARDRAAAERIERKRGRKPAERNPLAARVAQLESETRRLRAQLRAARSLVADQERATPLSNVRTKRCATDDDA